MNIDPRCCLLRSYKGEVIQVSEDSVEIAFDDQGELVEQTYGIDAFLTGRLPQKGDALEVCVQMLLLSKEDVPSQPRQPRKNVIPLPRIF